MSRLKNIMLREIYGMNKIIIFFSAIMSAYAFLADFAVDNSNQIDEVSIVHRFLTHFNNSIDGKGFLFSVLTICLCYLYCKLWKYCSFCNSLFVIVSIVLSFLTIIHYPYTLEGSLSLLFCSKFQLFKTFIFVCGYFSFFHVTITAFFYYLKKQAESLQCCQEVSYWKIAIKLAILWLPNIIVKFPGAFCPDSIWQFKQGMGLMDFTSHHPPFHTLMIKICVLIGEKIFHSYNIGSFIFVLLQYLIMTAIFAYTIYYLEIKGITNVVKCTIWIIYAICPLIIGFMGVILKDVIYSTFCVAFVVFCVIYLDNQEKQLSWTNVVGLIISGVLTVLTRNNGKEIIYPTLFVIMIVTIYKNIKNMKQWIRACMTFALPIVLSLFISKSLVSYYDIFPGSIAEALSFPFQQTARTVLEHSDEIPMDEREVIDRVLKYDTLAERYKPSISDPVKGGFNGEITREDMLAYVKVWIKHFIRYPITYCDATFSQNYPLFSLFRDCPRYYFSSDVEYENQVFIYENPVLKKIDEDFVLFYKNLHNIPITNFLSNAGFWCIMLIILTAYILYSREYDLLIALLPLWLTIACTILGPVPDPRYVFPVVYSIPFLFGYFVLKNSNLIV